MRLRRVVVRSEMLSQLLVFEVVCLGMVAVLPWRSVWVRVGFVTGSNCGSSAVTGRNDATVLPSNLDSDGAVLTFTLRGGAAAEGHSKPFRVWFGTTR
jgi:hypothetical protein